LVENNFPNVYKKTCLISHINIDQEILIDIDQVTNLTSITKKTLIDINKKQFQLMSIKNHI